MPGIKPLNRSANSAERVRDEALTYHPEAPTAGDKAPAYRSEVPYRERNSAGMGSIRDGHAVWTKGWSDRPRGWGLAAM